MTFLLGEIYRLETVLQKRKQPIPLHGNLNYRKIGLQSNMTQSLEVKKNK